MRNAITKNPENVLILQKLISNGHYKGFVASDRFELTRNHFPNNFRIIGILKESGKFLISSDYSKPLFYLVKIFNIGGIIFSISILILKTNWVIPLLYFLIRLASRLYNKLNSEKQMQLFTSKFLAYKRIQEDNMS